MRKPDESVEAGPEIVMPRRRGTVYASTCCRRGGDKTAICATPQSLVVDVGSRCHADSQLTVRVKCLKCATLRPPCLATVRRVGALHRRYGYNAGVCGDDLLSCMDNTGSFAHLIQSGT